MGGVVGNTCCPIDKPMSTDRMHTIKNEDTSQNQYMCINQHTPGILKCQAGSESLGDSKSNTITFAQFPSGLTVG